MDVGYILNLLFFIMLMLELSFGSNHLVRIIRMFFYNFGFFLGLHGTLTFIGKKVSKVWGLVLAGVVVFSSIAILLDIPQTYYILTSDFLCAGFYVYRGIASIRTRYINSIVRHIFGAASVVLGLGVAASPFVPFTHQTPRFILDIITGIAAFATAIYLQAAYYQSIRENQQDMNEKMKELVITDSLTGIYNRGFFELEMQRFDKEEHLPISIILGDVNGLKLINDIFGHPKGDELLVNTARIIKECSGGAPIARWGGDEFIVFLPKSDSKRARILIDRIKKRCMDFKEDCYPLNMSMGFATKEKTSQTISGIIKLADERLYKKKLTEGKEFRKSIIKVLEKAVLNTDIETEGHCTRLKEMAGTIGENMGLTDNQINDLSLLAFLHDIGKITIPIEILNKPGVLTSEEWEIMKGHSEAGYRIAISSGEFVHLAEAILHHHERWDGAGYPLGLKGKDIPLFSRIIAIADTFDAMTNDRPYKKAISTGEALKEIGKCAGTQFDPIIAKIFINMMRDAEASEAAAASCINS